MRPVEQMVDAAIERIAREHEQREKDRGSKREAGHALVVSSSLEDNPFAGRVPKRLRWKGLDVSEEFRSYAERIARGEDLPPFEGRVLAEPNPAFPWGGAPVESAPVAKGRGSRLALWGSASVVLALLGGSIALRFEANAQRAALVDRPTSAEAQLAPTSVGEAPRDAIGVSPQDVVETPSRDVPASDGAGALAAADPATAASAPGAVVDPPLHAAVAQPNSEAVVSASAPAASAQPLAAVATPQPVARVAAPVASPALTPAITPGATPGVRAPGNGLAALGVGASNPARAPGAASAPTAAPASAATAGDDFGIGAVGTPSGVSSAPAVSTAPLPAGVAASPSAAPVLGNVGNLARAGQPLPGAVRKEPGGESSAKGSLLVEVPSF